MLKRVVTVLLVLSFTQAALADAVQGYFGFNSSAVNFGVAYEHRLQDGWGVGGLFHFAGEEEDANVPEVITIAGITRAHFRPVSNDLDLYIGPGFGIHMVEDGGNNGDDENILGPSWQVGVLYQISAKASVGLEQLTIYNWMNDEGIRSNEVVNATVLISL